MYKLKTNQDNIETFQAEALIDNIVNQYFENLKKLKKLEALKNSLASRIKSYMKNHDLMEYGSNLHTVSLNTCKRHILSKELLIEMGIDDETLELCSKETVYQQLLVR